LEIAASADTGPDGAKAVLVFEAMTVPLGTTFINGVGDQAFLVSQSNADGYRNLVFRVNDIVVQVKARVRTAQGDLRNCSRQLKQARPGVWRNLSRRLDKRYLLVDGISAFRRIHLQRDRPRLKTVFARAHRC
jgi:hypothetical protein